VFFKILYLRLPARKIANNLPKIIGIEVAILEVQMQQADTPEFQKHDTEITYPNLK
jgi:hypothetical protein